MSEYFDSILIFLSSNLLLLFVCVSPCVSVANVNPWVSVAEILIVQNVVILCKTTIAKKNGF